MKGKQIQKKKNTKAENSKIIKKVSEEVSSGLSFFGFKISKINNHFWISQNKTKYKILQKNPNNIKTCLRGRF